MLQSLQIYIMLQIGMALAIEVFVERVYPLARLTARRFAMVMKQTLDNSDMLSDAYQDVIALLSAGCTDSAVMTKSEGY